MSVSQNRTGLGRLLWRCSRFSSTVEMHNTNTRTSRCWWHHKTDNDNRQSCAFWTSPYLYRETQPAGPYYQESSFRNWQQLKLRCFTSDDAGATKLQVSHNNNCLINYKSYQIVWTVHFIHKEHFLRQVTWVNSDIAGAIYLFSGILTGIKSHIANKHHILVI